MKKLSGLLIISLVVLISACGGGATQNQENAVLCPDTRPMMCTMDYNPVCGLRQDNSNKTYSNGCSACADATILSYTPGVCFEHILSVQEMRELFVGNTYEALILARKLSMVVYVDPDGTLRGEQGGRKFTSKWTINEQGEMCVSYRDKMNCRKVMLQDGMYQKFKVDEDGNKVLLVTYLNFAKGNIHNY